MIPSRLDRIIKLIATAALLTPAFPRTHGAAVEVCPTLQRAIRARKPAKTPTPKNPEGCLMCPRLAQLFGGKTAQGSRCETVEMSAELEVHGEARANRSLNLTKQQNKTRLVIIRGRAESGHVRMSGGCRGASLEEIRTESAAN